MSVESAVGVRKREYLEWVVENFAGLESGMGPLDGRAWSLNQARLTLGRDLEKANEYFAAVELTADRDFMGIRLLKSYLDFTDTGKFGERAEGHLRGIFVDWPVEAINSVARWPGPFHTENHDLMMLTIGMFSQKLRGQDMAEHVKQLAQSLSWRFEHGWLEWNSGRYQLHYVNPLMVLVDHAPDADLQQGAIGLLNLQLAERGLLSVDGYRGGPFVRGWDRHALPGPDGKTVQRGACAYFDNNRYDAYLPMVWLAFGLGEARFDYSKDDGLEPAGDGYGCKGDARLNQDEGMFLACSDFEPDAVVQALAADAKDREELVYKGTRQSWWVDDEQWDEGAAPLQVYYYNTRHVSMGSLQINGWNIQTRYNNVMFGEAPEKNLRIEFVKPGVAADRRRHERFGYLVQHRNWLLGRGELVEDGGVKAEKHGDWDLYRVGKGLVAHVELPDGWHVLQTGDLERFADEDAFLAALSLPCKDGDVVRGRSVDGEQLEVDLTSMRISINGQQRQLWQDMLHDSEPMRSVYGSGCVEIRSSGGELRLDDGPLRNVLGR